MEERDVTEVELRDSFARVILGTSISMFRSSPERDNRSAPYTRTTVVEIGGDEPTAVGTAL